MTPFQLPSLPRILDRNRLVRLAAELVVVFLGVTAAFLLEGWRQEQAEAERRQQIEAALLSELKTTTGNIENFLSTGRPFLENFREQIENGERPDLTPVYGTVRFTPHLWNATLESAGLEVLDVDFAYAVSSFYNNLEMAMLRMELLQRYTREVLLPNLDRGAGEFYHEDGTLRPEYRWYLQYWNALVTRSENLREQGEALVATLERRVDGTESPTGSAVPAEPAASTAPP